MVQGKFYVIKLCTRSASFGFTNMCIFPGIVGIYDVPMPDRMPKKMQHRMQCKNAQKDARNLGRVGSPPSVSYRHGILVY